MKKLFLSLAAVLLWAATAQAACDYYAAPSGSGDGLTQSTPFQIASFWAVSPIAGKTLCLMNGTYTGANSMIVPTSTLSGTAGNPITVKALNDGQVLIDGQYARKPVSLSENDYFVLEGFNAAHSGQGAGSDNFVISIYQSDNIIVRRVVAWDSWDSGVQTPSTPNTSDNVVWIVNSSKNGLYEDVAAFGAGRYVFLTYSFAVESTGNTFRRAFCHFTKQVSTYSLPRDCFSIQYNATDNLAENVIGQWQSLAGTTIPGENWGIGDGTGFDGFYGAGERAVAGGSRYYGVLMTTMADASNQPGNGMLAEVFGPQNVHFKDAVAYVPPAVTAKAALFPNPSDYSRSVVGIDLTGLTLVGGTGNVLGAEWVQTNVKSYATIAAMNTDTGNPFLAAAGNGARLCYRYVDGTLGTTPLWPWPMDARINDAVNAAGYSSNTFFGSGNNLTSYLESIFGTIPDACKTTATPAPGPVLVMGLDEGTGQPQDSSGFANHGTNGTGVTWTTGKYGSALAFAGAGGVTIADSASLDLVTGMTLEAWVYPTVAHIDFRGVIVKDYVYYMYGSVAGYCGAGSVLGGFNSGNVCYSTPLPINTWSHVATTYDSTTGVLNLYINGAFTTTSTAGEIAASAGALYLGAGFPGAGEWFEGKIDEVRVYNYARTQAQVVTDMNTPITAAAAPSALKVSAGSVMKWGAGAAAFKQGQ